MIDLINLLLHSFETYTITYKGDIYTNNDAQSMHWRTKGPIVSKYKLVFKDLARQAKLPWFDEFGLIVHYNSRHDADNISSFAKIAVDAMKKKYFKDDSKAYYKLFAVLPDPSLDKKEFKFTLIKIK